MIKTRFDLESQTARAALTFLTACIYAVAYVPLYGHFGAGVSALIAIPVTVAAWFFGVRAGLVAGLLAFPLNTLLLKVAGEPGGNVLVRSGEIITLVVVALIGAVIGWLGDSRERQLKRELATRERVQRSLRDSEIRFRRLFETAQDGILLLDADTGQITEVNPFLIEMLGYSRDEFLGKKLWEIGAVRDIETSQTAFRELQKKGYIRYENLPLQTKDGRRIHMEFVSNVYQVDDTKVIQCNIRDISERKLAEDALQQAHDKQSVWVQELEHRNRAITLLAEMGNLLQSCITADEVYTVIAQFAPQLFPAESGALGVLDTSHHVINLVVSWGELSATPNEAVFPPGNCWALRTGRLHRVENTHAALLCKHLADPLPSAYLCVPLSAQNETFGLLHLSLPPRVSGRLTEGKQQLAVTLAEHIGLALANLELRETLHSQSVRDSLTGLFNRRYLEESLEREVFRAKRSKSPLGIVMLDLDYFKPFNDTLGHEAGDNVLRELGTFLQQHVRGDDIACRYGGEEFTLILPGASLAVTRARADQLRERIKQLQVDYHGQLLGPLTVSLGVAILPDHGTSGQAVLRAADTALYRAKAAGRDRVVAAQ